MMTAAIHKFWITCCVALIGLLALPAGAGPQVTVDNARPTRTFKVALLLLESQTKAGNTNIKYWNPDPWFLTYINHSPFKPAGWTLDNPLAPGVLPDDGDLRDSGTGYADDPKGHGHNWFTNDGKATGDPITKDDPAYWIVKLDEASLEALSDYDLVILNGHGDTTLTNGDRDRLRYLLERGATIWVNNSQREGMQVGNFFTDPPIIFQDGPYPNAANTHLVKAAPSHWLLNGVYPLSDQEVNFLRDNTSTRSFIVSGVSGYVMSSGTYLATDGSQVSEVVRLTPAAGPKGYGPALAAGQVGKGFLIITGTDIMGGVSDWWENKHNYGTPIGLDVWPANATTGSFGTWLTKRDSYISCAKLFFNMLGRPTSGGMAAGDAMATRAYDRSLPGTLSPGWTAPGFTALADPVTSGNYVAAVGNTDGSATANKLRIYRTRMTDDAGMVLDYPHGLYTEKNQFLTPTVFPAPNRTIFPADVTAESRMDLCFTLAPSAGCSWVGSPIFGEITQLAGGTPITRKVIFALEARAADGAFRPRCVALDPYISPATPALPQVGSDLWSTSYTTNSGLPRASMTFANGRLLVTTLGKSSDNSPCRVFMYEAKTGILRTWVGGNPDWGTHLRMTGPATMISAQVDYEASQLELGDTSKARLSYMSNPSMQEFYRDEVVEMLVAQGEFFPANAPPNAKVGQTALFAIPPMIKVKLPQAVSTIVNLNGLAISDGAGHRHVIGDPTNDFRRKNILLMKAASSTLTIIFRDWSVFFPQGTNDAPPLTLNNLTVSYSPSGSTQRAGQTTSTPIAIGNLQLSMGYPLALQGSQFYNYPKSNVDIQRSYLRPADGDDTEPFGYAVDAPPLIYRDVVVTHTNVTEAPTYPALINTLFPSLPSSVRSGGAISGVRLKIGALSQAATNDRAGTAETAWQFFGDTHGPLEATGGIWKSDFPFPPAASKDTIYAVGLYNGNTDWYGGGNTDVDKLYATLYAINPTPDRFLRQVATAGTVIGLDAANQLVVNESALVGALRVGARALVKVIGNPATDVNTWRTMDVGRIQSIRTRDAGGYAVTVERPVDLTGMTEAYLLTATSIPHISHVRGWDNVTGAESIRQYDRRGEVATRLSEGISSIPAPDDSAVPVMSSATTASEVMIEVTNLHMTCHEPNTLIGTTLAPRDLQAFLPAAWKDMEHIYLPREPVVKVAEVSGVYPLNYVVDHRTGRIELTSRVAGELADRFVLVHYYTRELVNGAITIVRHAEVMYVPTQMKWAYRFPATADDEYVVPDSGPTLVNDTIYISAIRRKITENMWQPVLYAFPTKPANPMDVRPLWVQALGPTVTSAQPLPYRGVTSPVPAQNGLFVGTALANAENELALFADRGLLIADGHRVVRAGSDGKVTWQASATKDADPKALATNNVSVQATGVVQQGFTLLTRMRNLPNGHLLLCDTGGNRVVEMDRSGEVVWQYPDSDLTYQDPDRLADGSFLRSNTYLNTRIRKPTARTLRIAGPRDVRRYTKDITVARVTLGGADLGPATIRWESTLIADAGNNRILEVIRPLVRLENVETLNSDDNHAYARGFQYRPDLLCDTLPLAQTVEVIADAKKLSWNNAPYTKRLTFTQAMRYPGVNETFTVAGDVMDGVRTRGVLAAVGNIVGDPANPLPGKYLRTVHLELTAAANDAAAKAEILKHPDAALNTANALQIRGTSPLDYARVWQLDPLVLRDPATGNPDYRVLVVDQAGVREVPLAAQAIPTFEMTPATYRDAVAQVGAQVTGNWLPFIAEHAPDLSPEEHVAAKARIERWAADRLFVPVAVMRLDSGDGLVTNDPTRVRYLIAQANSIASADPATWIDGKAARRIHLFEARWDPDFVEWGIIDQNLDYFIYPDPVLPGFPSLPGWTYPLTQPFSVDRD